MMWPLSMHSAANGTKSPEPPENYRRIRNCLEQYIPFHTIMELVNETIELEQRLSPGTDSNWLARFQDCLSQQVLKDITADTKILKKFASAILKKIDLLASKADERQRERFALEEAFAEQVVQVMATTDVLSTGTCVRNYRLNGHTLTLQTSESLISQGTTGFSLWEASVACLAGIRSGYEHLCQQFVGKRVLELGSGTGLGGIGLACLSEAKELILTDTRKVLDEHLVANIESNRAHFRVPKVGYCELEWQDVAGLQRISPHMDVVFGCDLVYDPDLHELLLAALAILLRRPGPPACAVLVVTIRNMQTFQQFINKAASLFGFSVKTWDLAQWKLDTSIIVPNPEAHALLLFEPVPLRN